MGHEIIVYRDRHVIVNDLDLWAIRHFVLVEAEPSPAEDLAMFVRGWDWIGPGVYCGIDFDAFFSSAPEREQRFLDLLSRAARRIKAFGSHVPLDYLEKHVNLPAAFFTAPQPVDKWVHKVEKIGELFAVARRPPS